MLGPRGVALVALVAGATWGCTAGGGMRHDSGPAPDTGTPRMDAGPETCTTAAECDDSIACTIDECVVGNVCRHDPLDGRCNTAMGERCVAGRGCVMGMPTDCETAADCQDGLRCNGEEQCIAGGCFMANMLLDCDDGNACTEDICDEDAPSACRYEMLCDSGMVTVDAGPMCDAFEASHYAGTFTFRPSAASACTGSATYNISEITITSSGGTLSVRADRFTLTQSPAPTDGSFDVSFSDGCASFRLQGMFTCADQWTGMWTASFSGGCSFCAGQSMVVRGSRR